MNGTKLTTICMYFQTLEPGYVCPALVNRLSFKRLEDYLLLNSPGAVGVQLWVKTFTAAYCNIPKFSDR